MERNPDGSRTFHAPFILPWVWDAAPEGPSQQAPAFIELHACAQHGARLLVALEDGSAVGPDNSASVSGYNTIFSLGRTVPQGMITLGGALWIVVCVWETCVVMA